MQRYLYARELRRRLSVPRGGEIDARQVHGSGHGGLVCRRLQLYKVAGRPQRRDDSRPDTRSAADIRTLGRSRYHGLLDAEDRHRILRLLLRHRQRGQSPDGYVLRQLYHGGGRSGRHDIRGGDNADNRQGSRHSRNAESGRRELLLGIYQRLRLLLEGRQRHQQGHDALYPDHEVRGEGVRHSDSRHPAPRHLAAQRRAAVEQHALPHSGMGHGREGHADDNGRRGGKVHDPALAVGRGVHVRDIVPRDKADGHTDKRQAVEPRNALLHSAHRRGYMLGL